MGCSDREGRERGEGGTHTMRSAQTDRDRWAEPTNEGTNEWDRPTDGDSNGDGGGARVRALEAGPPSKVRWPKETIKMTSSYSRLSLFLPVQCPAESLERREDRWPKMQNSRGAEKSRIVSNSKRPSGASERATRGAMNPTSRREAEGQGRERGMGGRGEARSRSLRAPGGRGATERSAVDRVPEIRGRATS